jgi:very-short-patch-repair endonuclease
MRMKSLTAKTGLKYPRSPDEWLVKTGNTTIPNCQICKIKQVKWCGGASSFRETCGATCGTTLAQQRVLEKNNGNHPSQTPTVKTNRQKTNLEKYGVTSPVKTAMSAQKRAARMGDIDVKQRIRRTMLERYGESSPLKIEKFKKQQQQTTQKRFGVPNAMLNLQVVEQNKKANKARYEQTLLPLKTSRFEELGFLNLFPDGYNGTGEEYTWTHSCGISFSQILPVNGGFPRCPDCHKTGSHVEELLVQRLSLLGLKIERNVRHVIAPLEIDIWFPDLRVGVEINGEYWHSGDDRLLQKKEMAEAKSIRLLHFWASEVSEKTEIVLDIIKTSLCKVEKKIPARKCVVREIKSLQAREFLDKNHLAGASRGDFCRLGLFFEEELVAVATFCHRRFSKIPGVELLRFCSLKDTIIQGGLSKLIKHGKNSFNEETVFTFADRRISNGNAYNSIGKFIRYTKPGYQWFGYLRGKGWIKLNRLATQKHKLSQLLGDNFDEQLSEQANMLRNNWCQLKDCGNLVFVL